MFRLFVGVGFCKGLKLNVSAAVGGYRSETAVAVGTGYRFNEHFATKAGVSFNPKGGHTAYNVGVNFEW